MNVKPYVFYNGRCKEAAHFYADALGGEVGVIHHFGACVTAAKNPDAVQHTDVSIDGKIILQMSDGVEDALHSGFSVSLGVQTVEEAKNCFNNLVTEGVTIVPLAPSFFSPAFGMLTDKFGVSWMITVAV
ncbi:PhnB protein [Buttiauxella sp. JUb87]|jgi:PhnB protein|uniref:VOC family protein n=1 Tax=Buttiauxella sp. JUb87 TaxID=2485129 RepID=UPI0010600157|nr:VOC family protein [Buttiauxella sp. JUb87]TDN50111.1 PhnB protein [Buttiauxella sp. JUb87]